MNNHSPAKAIILSAGLGSRLGHLTSEVPKSMISVGGKPLCQWQVDLFQHLNVPPSFVTGYKPQVISNPFIDLQVFHNDKFASTNMVYSLFCARSLIESCVDKYDLVVSYGDIVYSQECIENVLASDAQISVSIDKNFLEYWQQRMDDYETDLESLSLDMRGNIISIGQKITNLSEVQGQYMGLFKISSRYLNQFINHWDCLSSQPEISSDTLYMTDFLQYLISQGAELKPVPNYQPWAEVDTPTDIPIAETRLPKPPLQGL